MAAGGIISITRMSFDTQPINIDKAQGHGKCLFFIVVLEAQTVGAAGTGRHDKIGAVKRYYRFIISITAHDGIFVTQFMFYAQSITPAVAPVFWRWLWSKTFNINIQSIIGTPFGISTVQFYPGPVIEFMVVTNSPAVRQSNFPIRFGKNIPNSVDTISLKISIHSMGHFAAVNQADLIFSVKSIIGSRIPA